VLKALMSPTWPTNQLSAVHRGVLVGTETEVSDGDIQIHTADLN